MDNQSGGANKAMVLGIVVFVIIAGGAWWYLSQKKETPKSEPIKTSEDIVGAVTAPEIDVKSNPLGNKVPEVNPVDRANPFKNSYKNPFE